MQDKRSRFVARDNQDYIEKANHKFERSSFEELDYDPSKHFQEEQICGFKSEQEIMFCAKLCRNLQNHQI